MRVPYDFRLRFLPGLGLAAVGLCFGVSALWGTEVSIGSPVEASVPSVDGSPLEQIWPSVGWGIEPVAARGAGDGRTPNGLTVPSLGDHPTPEVFSLSFGTDHIWMRFRADESGDLGPVVSVAAPSPREADETTSTKVNEDGALHLGNASFDRVAESLNLRPTGATKANDLSRQFGSAPAARNVASSVSIDGWAIIGILALVLIVGMAIGFYENDRDDRQRRKKNRRRRHRHSS